MGKMKFLPASCMCSQRHNGRQRYPKSNVSVKKLRKSKSKKSKKRGLTKRNSYIESSFKRNVYPIEHFASQNSSTPMEQFHVKSRRSSSRRRKKENSHWTSLTVLPLNEQQKQMQNTPPILCDNNNNNHYINPPNFVTASYYLNQNQFCGRRNGNFDANYEIPKPRHRLKVRKFR